MIKDPSPGRRLDKVAEWGEEGDRDILTLTLLDPLAVSSFALISRPVKTRESMAK